MTRTIEAKRQMLVLPLAPPRRLVPGAHYRSLKNQADRDVWRQAWQRVQDMEADGWRVERVEVDFGKTLPLMPSAAEEWLEAMCPGAPAVSWVWSGRGRGETRVFLVKRD